MQGTGKGEQLNSMKRYILRCFAMTCIMALLLSTIGLAVEVAVDVSSSEVMVEDILTEDEIAFMQSQEVYVVGYMPDLQPMSYLHGEELAGAAVDVFSAIAEALELNVEYVNLGVEGASINDVDFCITRQCPDIENIAQISPSYFDMPYVMIHNDNLGTTIDLPVGILAYYDRSQDDLDAMFDGAEVIVFSQFDDLNAAFADDSIRGMVLSTARYNVSKGLISSENYTIDLLTDHYYYAFAYPSHFSQDKIDILNKMIGYLDTSAISYSILNHSTYVYTPNFTLAELIAANPMRALQIAMIIVLIVVAAVGVMQALANRKEKRNLKRTLTVDSVTGLATLHHFETELLHLMDEKPQKQYTIFCLDIDNFKYINELYGYNTGTLVLKAYGEYLRETATTALVIARSFADQFWILIPTLDIHVGYLGEGAHFMEPGFADFNQPLGRDYHYSHSIGYYHITDPTLSISYMCNCAKLAKDLGKETAGLTIHGFTPQMSQERDKSNEIVSHMKTGVANKEFVVYYQPQVHLKTEQTVGAEALVRWVRDGKLVPPNDFIPIFEKNGFIETLDYYVLGEVCQFIQSHKSDNLPVISVNLSGVTIMKHNFVQQVAGIVDSYGLSPRQLDLEITESALIKNFAVATDKIRQLRELGFTIAMDDFGVGISSLGRLKNIPLDTLKIDRQFIVDALGSKKGASIVAHIVGMAQELQLETVAEGLETNQQIEFFRNLGCDVGQGYGFARPMPQSDFLAFLEKQN